MSEEFIEYAYIDGSECVTVTDPMLDAKEEDLDLRRPERSPRTGEAENARP